MLLRFRGRDGQFRLDVDPNDDFPTLTPKIAEHIPKNVDLTTLRVGPKPQGGDARNPADLRGITLQRVGLK
jgi:nuclear protein localization protein 4 homolog